MFRSFCLTIRPRDGIKDNLVSKITSWLKKQQYAVAVLEMENEARHLHAQIWSDNERHKNDITKQMKRFCEALVEDWDNAQTKVLRGGVKIAYSDWYLEYLTNNDDKNDITKQMKRFCEALVEDWDNAQTKVLRGGVKIAYSDWYLEYLLDNDNKEYNDRVLINNPPDKTEQFYPTEEEQTKVKEVANSIDPRFTKLEHDFYDWCETINCEYEIDMKSIARFLNWSMFEERTIKVIIQPRDRYAFCQSLYLYITKSKDVYNFIPKTNEEKKLDKNFQILFDSMKAQNIEL